MAGGRYKFLSDGSLQIVGLTQMDHGEYICVAENGIGEPARKTFNVRVRGKCQWTCFVNWWLGLAS